MRCAWYQIFTILTGNKRNDMINNVKRDKYPRYSYHRHTIPDWMGYPGSDYGRYDPGNDEGFYGDSNNIHHLEGAGREGWDFEQNKGYGEVDWERINGPGDGRADNRGKGPRNYRRSDQRIMEDIVERLPDSGVENLEIDVREGEVLLSGKVDSRRIRHLVEDLAEDVPGVRHVENGIRISGK